MKTRYTNYKYLSTLLLLVFASLTCATDGFCAQVNEAEAVAVADLWYAMEINSKHMDLEPAEKAARIADVKSREVLYLVSRDELRNTPPTDGKVLAYIVKYQPNGFVVVSGEDRIDPILVFNAEGTFRWDQSDHNFLRYYLGRALVGRWESLERRLANKAEIGIHRNWQYLRSRLAEHGSLTKVTHRLRDGDRGIYVKWDTALWHQWWPYNETVQVNNGNTIGIPTGCTATAMAIKMRYHEWPPQGTGFKSYQDDEGSIQYYHAVDFSNQTYDWASMPTTPITQQNLDVADLMYHCGVAVEMNYEVGESGAWPSASTMNGFFHYKGTIEVGASHEPNVSNSIIGGLPVVLSSSEHTVLACGYRDSSPYFFLNCGWDGSGNDWYNLDQIPGGDPTIDRSYPYCQPENYIYVSTIGSSNGDGTLLNPCKYLSQGYNLVPDGGQLWFDAGTYSVPSGGITFKKALAAVNVYNGPVTIK